MNTYTQITFGLILLIFFLQCIRGKLFTSCTIWVFFYFCFFVLSPILLGYNYITEDRYAMIGMITYFITYLIMILFGYTKKTKNETDVIRKQIVVKKLRTDVIDHNITFLLIMTLLMLVLSFGPSNIIALIRGQTSTRNLLSTGGSVGTIYTYLKSWTSYAIVLLFIAKERKLKIKHIVSISTLSILFLFFSFTRSDFIIPIGMVAFYLLFDKDTITQIKWAVLVIGACALLMSFMMVIRVWGVSGISTTFSLEYFMKTLANDLDFSIGYIRFGDLLEQHSNIRITPFVYAKVFFLAIPRSIWAEKPLRGSVEIFKQINHVAYTEGLSTCYTNLGVAYAVFGVLGVVIAPAFWGIITNSIDLWFMRKKSQANNAVTFFYLYFSVAMLLQSFREGTDVAILNIVLVTVAYILITQLDILHMRLYLKPYYNYSE